MIGSSRDRHALCNENCCVAKKATVIHNQWMNYDTNARIARPPHAGGSPALSFCFLYREYQASMSGDMDMISSRRFFSTTSDFAFAIHPGCDFGWNQS